MTEPFQSAARGSRPADVDRHLATMLGAGMEFREGQREAIESIVEDRARVLLVQRTGWGKSLVYWIATRIRRDRGAGPTLIISPLLALMRNQLDAAARLGLRAITINSANREEWDEAERALASDEADVLMISPERLGNEDFVGRILPAIQRSIGLLVIDEAHCISDWGHDFRPDYRRVGRILDLLPPVVPVLATTATANDRVVGDLVEQLGDHVRVTRGPLDRESLRLQVIHLDSQAERLAWLAAVVPRLPGSGIIYCLTVADTSRVAAWLRTRGIAAWAYNADLMNDERIGLERALVAGDFKALVATVALGMGFDKPDLGFVVHYQRPTSAIAYYQQVGRAGRAVDRAYGIVLTVAEDDEIAEYFIENAFPPTVHLDSIVQRLDEVESATVRDLEGQVNLKHTKIEQALKLLEVDGVVAHERGRWFRTANAWSIDHERIERVKESKRAELRQIQDYTHHRGCLMEFLQSALDDPSARPCGRCANCRGPGFDANVDARLVAQAAEFLGHGERPIKPKKLWIAGPVPELSGRILPPNEPGIALCSYGDPGWGRIVAKGKYTDGFYDSSLVEAAAALITESWRPEPPPEWITALPSTSARGSVHRFAAELAILLALPLVDCLSTVDGRPQKEMLNSVQQLRNAHVKLGVDGSLVLPGPVLLVDDIADSGWTLTIAGWLLRSHGSGPVHPFALAVAAGRSA